MKHNHFVFAMVLLSVLSGCFPVFAENPPPMIAVAAQSTGADALISNQAARCAYFLFFNDQGEFMEAVENSYQGQGRNAGKQVAEFLFAEGVRTVIAGEFGAKMSAALKEKNIALHIATGNAASVVQQMQKQ
jgi:predicted Fe-Mo cluster-binding NifX family protein